MKNLPVSGVELIKQFEGCYLRAYNDPLSGGKPITIGWGSTKKKNGEEWILGDVITQLEADELLILQLQNNYLPPLTLIPTWGNFNENQRGALLSFAYNLGAHFYNKSGFTTISRLINSPEMWTNSTEVIRIFCLYRNPGTRVEAGLRRRRTAEAELFLKPLQ